MLRITSFKIKESQIFPERYPDEHSDMQFNDARDESESQFQNAYYVELEYSDNRREKWGDDGFDSEEEARMAVGQNIEELKSNEIVEAYLYTSDGDPVTSLWPEETLPEPAPQPMF